MKIITSVLLLGLLSFAGTSAAQAPSQQKPSATPKSAAGAHGTSGARSTYDRTLLRPALLKDKAPETYQVKFTTTKGEFIVTVTRAWAPLGADRFYNLVKHRFYDNASFFRAVPNFVVQFGMSAYPPVSAVWENANIKDEPVTQTNKRGYLTFAKTSNPNTRSTQVFISLKENSFLDAQGFAPFGVVDGNGMTVVDSLYQGYGDQAGPDQGLIAKEGKAYLDKNFPKLDSIKTAVLVGAAPTPSKQPAPKPAPKPTSPGPIKQ
jgi:peptidyl-prolyl cis-trans isomerase A (cyclophilin A)